MLEYAAPTAMQRRFYESIEFWSSKLVITGFCGVAHDVDAQYENIRNLAVAGEAGMILCYVGLILPALDPRPIQLADELGFILICMPENEPKLCYSEVTNEVMDAIIRDELNVSAQQPPAYTAKRKYEKILPKLENLHRR